jgi:hypothetical protein
VVFLNDPLQQETPKVLPVKALDQTIRNVLFARESRIELHHFSDGPLIFGLPPLRFLLSG